MRQVRRGLAAVQARRAPGCELFEGLEQLAERAALGTGIGGAVEAADLVGELLQGVCAGEFASVDWLALSDGQARGLLLRRLRQLAVELSPGWNGYRALRAMVARAFADGLPDAPEAMPLTIYEHGRLSPGQVALAAAAARRDTPGPAATLTDVTRALARWYLPHFVPIASANDDLEIEGLDDLAGAPESMEDRLDAARLHEGLRATDPDGLRLVQRRVQGESLDAIAREDDAGITTIHTRVRKAASRISAFVRDRGFSASAVRACLESPVFVA